MASSHENGLSKAQARLLYAVCACNYLRLPLARQHKPSIFVSRFVPSRHFFTCSQLSGGARIRVKTAGRGFAFKLFYQKNGAVQLWLNKNRLPASGPLKSTVVRIWYWTPSGRPHKVYFVSLACLPSVFVQFICAERHFFTYNP